MYTSPKAGAYFSLCIEPESLRYSKYTYQHLDQLREQLGDNCGIGRCRLTEHIAEDRMTSSYWLELKFAGGLRAEFSHKPGYVAVLYDAFSFNPPVLLRRLFDHLKGQGVQFERKKLTSLDQALAHGPVVFNCCGLGASELVGDALMVPTRGQVVLVRAPEVTECISLWDDDSTYVISRPDCDEVVLGGFYQEYNADVRAYDTETEDILRRTAALHPALAEGKYEVVKVQTGIRPRRKGGVRIHRHVSSQGVVIHNYGAGGEGYLCGLGMAHHAIALMGPKL